ncbi:hypothetical protein Avbf_04630 [Armadillidium vulgare]|nr:hypothetical protein Avbf_04630 [Armadillidium vulgare]
MSKVDGDSMDKRFMPRACKGKRYEEFISKGILINSRNSQSRNNFKLPKQDNQNHSPRNTPSKIVPNHIKEEEEEEKQQQQQQQQHGKDSKEVLQEIQVTDLENKSKQTAEESQKVSNKTNNNSGFDLEARIEALPSLNLEEFTIRKKEKKRSLSGPQRHNFSSSQENEHSEGKLSGCEDLDDYGENESSSKRLHLSPKEEKDTLEMKNELSFKISQNCSAAQSLKIGKEEGMVCDTHSKSNHEETKPCIQQEEQHQEEKLQHQEYLFQHHQQNNVQPQLIISSEERNLKTASHVDESSSEVGKPQLTGSQKRKARKQTITRHDPFNSSCKDISVVEPAMLSNIRLQALAEVAVTQLALKVTPE